MFIVINFALAFSNSSDSASSHSTMEKDSVTPSCKYALQKLMQKLFDKTLACFLHIEFILKRESDKTLLN